MSVMSREDGFPVSVQYAVAQTQWWARYAFDRLGHDGRTYHPGVAPHLQSVVTHIGASVDLSQPAMDSRRVNATGREPLWWPDNA